MSASDHRDPVLARTHLRQAVLTALVIVAFVTLAYARALSGAEVWDDDAHITAPALRSLEGLGRIWFDISATQQYYPLLHSAFWAEHALWGDATLGYHLVNVVLHSTAACLFGLLLWKLRVRGALIAAGIFALHPVHVESVAWISEQKNTLSLTLYLAATLLYFRFKSRPSFGRYTPALLVFVLALLTKSVTATLPAALLVIVWWKEGGVAWRRDVLPLLPWFVLGAAAGLFTAWVERKYIGAEGAGFELSFVQRVLLAGHVVWFYATKLIWPANLTFIYPRWNISPANIAHWAPLIGFLVLTIAVWRFRLRSRAPLAVLLLFAGTLFPVLGFLNVYPFRYSFVADHFQYAASLAIIALGAVGIAHLFTNVTSRRIVAALLIGALGLLTFRQSADYRDAETLWRATIARNPRASMAWVHLGNLLAEAGRHEEALSHFRRAIEVNRLDWDAYNNVGALFSTAGRFADAWAELERALAINPRSAEVHNNIGFALRGLGRLPEAITHYQTALRLQPRHLEANNNLGVALLESNRAAEAIVYFERALRQAPEDAQFHHNLGNALRALGRLADAIARYEQALRLQPNLAETHDALGVALAAASRPQGAIEHHLRALALKPSLASAHFNLGQLFAQANDNARALEHFEHAVRMQPGDAAAHLQRGIVLTQLDRWEDARDAFARAVQLQPESAAAHRNLAMALANTGAVEAAQAALEKALALDPNSAETHTALSVLYRALGRADEAETHRLRAQELNRIVR